MVRHIMYIFLYGIIMQGDSTESESYAREYLATESLKLLVLWH